MTTDKTNLSILIARLEYKATNMKALAGEILTTLLLEQNQDVVPEEIKNLATVWQRRYKKIITDTANK